MPCASSIVSFLWKRVRWRHLRQLWIKWWSNRSLLHF